MERILARTDTMVGFAAKAKGTNKWLRNYWQGGMQTGTNAQSLTEDKTRVTIDQEQNIKMYCNWYNNTHKVPVEFEIVEVVKTTKTTIDFEVK